MNFKYFISYSGLLPFIIFISDIYFFGYLDYIFILDMSLYIACIIFTFIGAYNWDFYRDNIVLEIYGFIPSLISMILILMNELTYDKQFIFEILIFFLIIQLIIDFFITMRKLFPVNYFLNLRIPVTGLLAFCLIVLSKI